MAAKTAYSPSVKGKAALTLAGSNEYHARIGLLLKADPFRWRCLLALQSLQLPQGYIGAGFLRNCIWDSLLPEHRSNFTHSSPLNDIDVIYFDVKDTSKETERLLETQLSRRVPEANWQVRNQARLHLKHGHAAYKNCEEAVSYWIERETCVAVRLTDEGKCDILAPYGIDANFSGTLSINPQYPRPSVFRQRVNDKGWLTLWPFLTLSG